VTRPFRFIAPMPRLDQPVPRWRDALRRIEDLGFSSVSISDHFTRGWVMDPIVAMTAAAEATERLRVLSLVFGNDYRHPVMLHKAMATLDVLSGGRVEIGLGAGWMLSDYQAAGIVYDRPSVRVGRLEESVAVLKGLFGKPPFDFQGDHYRLNGLDGLPKATQQPHPPLLVGGGGEQVLSLAGRNADIVGVAPRFAAGVITADLAADLGPGQLDRKLGWVRAAATAAGRSMDDIELQLSLVRCRVSNRTGDVQGWLSSIAGAAVDPRRVEQSVAVLSGSVERCVELLQERRERFGISYLNLGGDIEAVAPVVERLAGR
jgi:probable F420-dependent oxidoreductase